MTSAGVGSQLRYRNGALISREGVLFGAIDPALHGVGSLAGTSGHKKPVNLGDG